VEMQTKSEQAEKAEADEKEKMCCEGGMTAAEHRSKSPDGKCCTD